MCPVYTSSELQRLSDKQLCALFGRLTRQLYEDAESQSETLTSLENLRRVIAQRKGPRP